MGREHIGGQSRGSRTLCSVDEPSRTSLDSPQPACGCKPDSNAIARFLPWVGAGHVPTRTGERSARVFEGKATKPARGTRGHVCVESRVLICPDCGARNLPTAELCVSCGSGLEAEVHVPPDDDLVGRVLGGKYELEETIGEGSMGRVYAARQLELDKEVAVKVLHPHIAADPKVAKRFQREARTASLLSHPNSLEVFDFGREVEGPLLFIVMELLDGPDLLELIEEEFPFSPRRIAHLVGGVLLALEEAHDRGVIHRDLKAENIMVVEDHQGREHVKVCDFGIAKLVETDGSAITVTGFVCGTPEYMAPEQARGEELDARADLYAIGCVLYQLLTGQVPFKAGSALGTITKHLTEPVEPPSVRRPDLHIPRSLERVVMRALSKDRNRRFANAGEMRRALEAAVDELGPLGNDPLGTHDHDPTRAVRSTSHRQQGLFAIALALGGLLVGGGLALVLRSAPAVRPADAGVPANQPTADAEPAAFTSMNAGVASCDDGSMCAAPLQCCATCSGWSCAERCVEPRCDGGIDAAAGFDSGSSRTVPRPRARRAPRATRTVAMQPTASEDRTEPPGRAAFEEGRRRFLQNDTRGAIERFETAARAMPRNAQVHKELARAYMRIGDAHRGAAAYRRYLELAPNAPDRALVEQMLEQALERR